MALRTAGQKIGAQGHRWVMSAIESHPHWLARDLSEDYGVDAEVELTEQGVRGEILKIQVKTSKSIHRRNGKVRVKIERKYVQYAEECRYPVLLVIVDLSASEAWYLWLQYWVLSMHEQQRALKRTQSEWTYWIPETQTLSHGLDGELKEIARWKGDTQLVLSLLDAFKAATAIGAPDVVSRIVDLISCVAPRIEQTSLDIIVAEALRLGDRLRGTLEGNAVADQLFALVRRFGGRLATSTVDSIVSRDDAYSRTGVTALGILYDEHFEHARSLGLPQHFLRYGDPRVAYYCAFRETNPEHKSINFMVNPAEFRFAGLRYAQPEMSWDKYANRGPSALLDYLVPECATERT